MSPSEQTPVPVLQNQLLGTSLPDIQTQDGQKVGYITDYISGKPVKATKEEIEAVQVFSRRLVEDYGYPKSNIRTRPQFGVKKSPSDTKNSYPVDIAVFTTSLHNEDNISIVVECKKKNRKDGLKQLEIYLSLSSAESGV